MYGITGTCLSHLFFVPNDCTSIALHNALHNAPHIALHNALHNHCTSIALHNQSQVGSDLLISVNVPLEIGPRSAAAEHAQATGPEARTLIRSLMDTVLSTLIINDWGLFG